MPVLPAVSDGAVTLTVPDRRYRRVALSHELREPRAVEFRRRAHRGLVGKWTKEQAERLSA